MKNNLQKSTSNEREINTINSTLNKLAETVWNCSSINHGTLAKYIRSLSTAKKIFQENRINNNDIHKIKEQLPRVIEAAENTIARIMV